MAGEELSVALLWSAVLWSALSRICTTIKCTVVECSVTAAGQVVDDASEVKGNRVAEPGGVRVLTTCKLSWSILTMKSVSA